MITQTEETSAGKTAAPMTIAEAIDKYGWTILEGPREIIYPRLNDRHYAGDSDKARFTPETDEDRTLREEMERLNRETEEELFGTRVVVSCDDEEADDKEDPYQDAYVEVPCILEDEAHTDLGVVDYPAEKYYDGGEYDWDWMEEQIRECQGHKPYIEKLREED